MKKYSKEKQKQVVLVGLLSVMVLCGLWFGLVKFQKESLERIAQRKVEAAQHLEQVKSAIGSAEQLAEQQEVASKTLEGLEKSMAQGDLYAWAINMVRQFKVPYKVDIPQFSQIDGPKPTSLLPNFPYQQATLTIGGTAYYQDLGRFIADFENTFPYVRLMNLSVEPASALSTKDKEKLAFKLDVAALIKPGTS